MRTLRSPAVGPAGFHQRHRNGARTAGAWALAVALLIAAAGAAALTACSRGERAGEPQLSKRVVPLGEPVPKGGGRYKVGDPYKIGGEWYRPKEDPNYDRVGTASWYGELFHGRYTANGEIYDMGALSAAHPTLPLPSYAQVTNLENGRSLVVRVNDRGPYAHDRIIDLSRRTAGLLDFQRNGTARVRVRYLGKAPLDGDDSYERRVLASQPWINNVASRDSGQRWRMSKAETRADPMVVGSLPEPEEGSKSGSAGPSARTDGSAPVFVQAAAFRNKVYAESLRDDLRDLGPAGVFQAEVDGATYYRVRLGPYAKRRRADETLRAVVRSGHASARIVAN